MKWDTLDLEPGIPILVTGESIVQSQDPFWTMIKSIPDRLDKLETKIDKILQILATDR